MRGSWTCTARPRRAGHRHIAPAHAQRICDLQLQPARLQARRREAAARRREPGGHHGRDHPGGLPAQRQNPPLHISCAAHGAKGRRAWGARLSLGWLCPRAADWRKTSVISNIFLEHAASQVGGRAPILTWQSTSVIPRHSRSGCKKAAGSFRDGVATRGGSLADSAHPAREVEASEILQRGAIEAPVHVIVDTLVKRHVSRLLVPHLWSGKVPLWCFCKLSDGVFVKLSSSLSCKRFPSSIESNSLGPSQVFAAGSGSTPGRLLCGTRDLK